MILRPHLQLMINIHFICSSSILECFTQFGCDGSSRSGAVMRFFSVSCVHNHILQQMSGIGIMRILKEKHQRKDSDKGGED